MHSSTMAAGRSSPTLTQSDDVEVMSAKSFSVLDTEPPDYVEKISRFLESSVARGEQVSNEPAEAESDSGDSLFLTQKPAPEPVRPQRRQRSLLSARSQPVTPRSLEESGSDDDSDSDCSSSALQGQSKTDKGSKRKKYYLPKYSFPFLSERKWKPEGSLLNRKQNINLHYATIGGFLGCVREQWKGCQGGDDVASSLPTVNMEGDYISPLTESEDERSGDDDFKIVEKKDFAFPSKANRRQTWCSRSTQRRGKAHETPRTRQQKTQTENPKTKNQSKTRRSIFKEETKEQELFDDSDITDCEPPTLQWDPRQSTDVPEPQTDVVPVDGLSQTWQEQPEAQKVPHCDNDDDSEYSRTRLKSRENKEGEGDHESVEEESSQGQDEPEGLHAAPSVDVEETDRQSEENIAEPPALGTSEVLGFNEINCTENAPYDDPIVREEERETPDLKQKKKNRKKSLAGDVRQEVDGNLKSGMKLAESMLSVSSGVESDSKEKRKKRRKKGGEDDEGDEYLQPDVVTEPLNDHAETQRKKKKKRKEKTVVTDEHEDEREEEPSNRTLNLPPVSAGQLEESAHSPENTAASQDTPLNDHAEIQRKKKKKRKEKTVITDGHEEEEPSSRTLNLPPVSAGQSEESARFVENTQDTLERSFVKRKKHKKKHRSSSNDAAKDGAEGDDDDDAGAFQQGTVSPKKKKSEISDEIDTSYSPDNNERVKNVDSMENTTEGLEYQSAEIVTKKKKKKKKKKEIPEGVDTSYTLGGSEMVEVIGDTEKTHSGLDDQTAELVIKKKRKKKSKLSSSNLSEDSIAQSNDSVSVQEKEKMRTASFLTADAEENDAQTHQEENRVKKKNRKRKMSVQQDSMERDHGQDFEEAKRTCLSTLPETADTRVKRKQGHEENKGESETPVEQTDSRADGGGPLTHEALMMKKKKKKKKKKSKDEAPAD